MDLGERKMGYIPKSWIEIKENHNVIVIYRGLNGIWYPFGMCMFSLCTPFIDVGPSENSHKHIVN